ncbi:Pol polyprotein [Biomphalaria glabrata]|nr:hypothetical protein BgiMline_034757 [Biomphalaria glabrata]KAI8760836.1 hypothetical protein BgiMline_007989 [Biomphalaria glabrata]
MVPRADATLRKFNGDGPVGELEDFLQSIERCWRLQHLQRPEDKCDLLYAHLGESVKDELRCHPQVSWDSPEEIVDILRSEYGDRRNISVVMEEFIGVRQQPRETVQSYTIRLQAAYVALAGKLQSKQVFVHEDVILREHFVNHLSDDLLRRLLREKLWEHPETSFVALRETAMRWTEEGVHTSNNVCQQLANLSHQVDQLTAKLSSHFRSGGIRTRRPLRKSRRCYSCGMPGHLARDCKSQKTRMQIKGQSHSAQRPLGCQNCGSWRHLTSSCPKDNIDIIQVAPKQPEESPSQPSTVFIVKTVTLPTVEPKVIPMVNAVDSTGGEDMLNTVTSENQVTDSDQEGSLAPASVDVECPILIQPCKNLSVIPEVCSDSFGTWASLKALTTTCTGTKDKLENIENLAQTFIRNCVESKILKFLSFVILCILLCL